MALSSRLDPKGVLLEEPGNGVKESSWVGPSKGQRTAVIEPGQPPQRVRAFAAVQIDGQQVSVGDCVYLTPDNKDEPCEIARVCDMFEADQTADKHIEVQWFWRPEHIVMPHTMEVSEREVFLSETLDTNPIEAFECRCSVVQLRESDPVPVSPHEPHTFFYCRTYDPIHSTFKVASGCEAPPPPPPPPPPTKPPTTTKPPSTQKVGAGTTKATKGAGAKGVGAKARSAGEGRGGGGGEAREGDSVAPAVARLETVEEEPEVLPGAAADAAVGGGSSAATGSASVGEDGDLHVASTTTADEDDDTATDSHGAAPRGSQSARRPPPRKRKASTTPPPPADKKPKEVRKGAGRNSGGPPSSSGGGSGGRGGGGDASAAVVPTEMGQSPRLAVLRLQERVRDVRASVRMVQRELQRLSSAPLREATRVVDAVREKQADLVRKVDELDVLAAAVPGAGPAGSDVDVSLDTEMHAAE
jgi:hypothetical protein